MNRKIPVFQKADNDINFRTKEKNSFLLRTYIFPSIVFFAFLILTLRLFQVTIVRGSYFRTISEKNRVKEITLEAPRGTIVDRKGFSIAYSVGSGDKQIRTYNDGLALAHVIGYRQLASKEDIQNDLCDIKVRSNDKVGKSGIERAFECQLRGVKGRKLVETNAQGKLLKTLSIDPPIEGKRIQLSIDLELQKKAYELIQDKKGSVIAAIPQTGEILVLTSSPSFDPQEFENNNTLTLEGYFKNEDQPLFDRATKALYPPGSVFKPVLAAGALHDNIIDSKFEIEDTGFITAGPAKFGNWYYLEHGKTEGMVNVVKALKRSNDIFFYKIGEKMGEDNIKKWAQKFGYGHHSGIAIDDSEGLLPSPFWKKDRLKEQWYLGDTYNFSIGQGYLQVTPLQVSLATLPLANGGKLCKPQLIKDHPAQCTSLDLSKSALDVITEGMKEACAPGGTGWPLFNFSYKDGDKEVPMDIACKTGTAESHAESGKPHAWFTAYAPINKPQIVITVMLEEAGQGSDMAAPIAKELFKAYFERRN